MRKRFLAIAMFVLGLVVVFALGKYLHSVIHQTVQTKKASQHYLVSFGDSVAAGAGLSGNNNAGSCDLSSSAYPVVLAKKLGEPVEQFACSGAKVTAAASNSLLSTQFPQAKPFLAGNDVVVTAGANDIDWLQTLEACAQTACQTADPAISAKISTMGQNLTQLLLQIQQAHPRKVVVNTYYSLLKPGDSCFANLGITQAKIAYITAEQAQLNAAITAAAKVAKATPIQIDFNGHLLCDANSYLQKLADPAPLHPTAAGQVQIANQDAEAFSASR